MAHFTNAQGIRISGQPLDLQVGESKEIGLWGFRDFGGQPLTVGVMTPAGDQCSDLASVFQVREQGDICYYRVRGLRAGTGRIDALAHNASMWDNLQLHVGGSSSGIHRIVQALDDGTLRLNFATDASFLRSVDAGSTTVALDPLIVNLMNNLLTYGSLDVMSLLRPGKGQHGVVTGSLVTCKAIDIQGFRGVPVRLQPRETAINVVCRILERFPDGQFDVGFPRPVGGPTGFNPTDDVFFSVPDLATAQQCWDGNITRSLSQMLQPAQDRVRMAMVGRARFRLLYPDGLNHMHIATVSPA